MSGPNFMKVKAELVREVLVGRILDDVLERHERELPAPVEALLDTDEEPRDVTTWLTRAGYLSRVVEVELFEPARSATPGLEQELRERFSDTGSWPSAVADWSRERAAAEPLERPDPDDEQATTWRVPGPGGHVRHYVARQSIEEVLHGKPVLEDRDPAELKRIWTYGFLVRCCEEVLPPEASLEPPYGDGATG